MLCRQGMTVLARRRNAVSGVLLWVDWGLSSVCPWHYPNCYSNSPPRHFKEFKALNCMSFCLHVSHICFSIGKENQCITVTSKITIYIKI